MSLEYEPSSEPLYIFANYLISIHTQVLYATQTFTEVHFCTSQDLSEVHFCVNCASSNYHILKSLLSFH